MNAAFIVDQATKDALVEADPKSAEILKPVLRGRDIARYRANWAGLWLIDTHNGFASTPPIKVEEYPAVKAHLDTFIERLGSRYDKGITPYNLRNCAYHAQFSEEKLFWMDLTPAGRFSYSPAGAEMFCVNTVYFMHGPLMKQLVAYLNSSLITWYVNKTAATSGMGTTRWFAYVVEGIPVPSSISEGSQLEGLVDRLLRNERGAAKKDVETAIEDVVYQSYGITKKEREELAGRSCRM